MTQTPFDFATGNIAFDANAEDVPDLIPDEGSPEAKKPKKVKIPLDRRIELTDEELKVFLLLVWLMVYV